MKDISRILSENLRNLRCDRQLSLKALSELTEVSKAMLGQIECGESNPTMNTLWKIANGLQISFTSLIAYNHDEVQVMQGNELVPLDPEDPHYRVYALEEFNPTKNVELYLVEIEPHHEHHSPVHNVGVEESITVMLGEYGD